MSISWFKNRITDLKYIIWLIKNWSHLKKSKYSLFPFFIYWILYPIPRLIFGREKASYVSQNIIKRFISGDLIIPIPVRGLRNCYTIIRDSSDFDTFREVCINDHYNLSQLKPGMTVIDIGAHIGLFTLPASFKVGQRGKIIAVEPEDKNFNCLQKNLKINGIKNVIGVKTALSDFNGQEDFFISKGSGCHSLFPREGDNILKKIQIEVKTLDSLLRELNIERVDLLKIDVEGAELKILKGGRETLIKNPQMKMVIASYHFPQEASEVVKYLKKLNFSPKIIPGIFTLVVV
jgi:FkbM family methyltransferase